MSKLAILIPSVVLSLAIGFFALCVSPRDPTITAGGRGDLPPSWGRITGLAKLPTLIEHLRTGSSYTFGREPAWRIFARRLPWTVGVNLPGVLLGWATGFGLGCLIGRQRGRPGGRILLALTALIAVVPGPVWILCNRMAWLDSHLFLTGNPIPAALAVAWLGFAPIAINQATVVGMARQRPDVIFAEALGLPAWVRWRHLILPHGRSFWRSQRSLLFVAACEGSILVEQVFAIPGLGQAAFEACTRSDTCLVLLLVGFTSTLVNLGVLSTLGEAAG
jgi:ABC-type dipeptide/oligopeptide/nickel transport system permease component